MKAKSLGRREEKALRRGRLRQKGDIDDTITNYFSMGSLSEERAAVSKSSGCVIWSGRLRSRVDATDLSSLHLVRHLTAKGLDLRNQSHGHLINVCVLPFLDFLT